MTLRLVLAYLILFSGCQKPTVYNDKTGRIAGKYKISTYVLNGDTLLREGEENPIFDQFTIQIGRLSADSVSVVTNYREAGKTSGSSYYRTAGVLVDSDIKSTLKYKGYRDTEYEASISNGVFREHHENLSGGYLILPEGYVPQWKGDHLIGMTLVAEKEK